jgi:hypothetical protein
MTMITGEANVRKFVVLQVIHGLALEIGTGMKLSRHGSALQAAKIQKVVPDTCRNKKNALKLSIEYMKTLDPAYEPSPIIKRALDK